MVNTVDYSELKNASEVLERQRITPPPQPQQNAGKSQPVLGGRRACLSPRERLGPSRGSLSTISRDIGGGLSAKSCF